MWRYATGLFLAGLAISIFLVLRHDAGPRSLALVVDPRLNRSSTFGLWATNIGQPEGESGSWWVSVDRSADETLRIELTLKCPPHRHRIEFWLTSESRAGLRVRGREGT